MFNPGDKVRYHGRRHGDRSRQQTYGGSEMIIDRLYAPSARKESSVWRVRLLGGALMNVYDGDIDLIAPAAPEEYEAWFVA